MLGSRFVGNAEVCRGAAAVPAVWLQAFRIPAGRSGVCCRAAGGLGCPADQPASSRLVSHCYVQIARTAITAGRRRAVATSPPTSQTSRFPRAASPAPDRFPAGSAGRHPNADRESAAAKPAYRDDGCSAVESVGLPHAASICQADGNGPTVPKRARRSALKGLPQGLPAEESVHRASRRQSRGTGASMVSAPFLPDEEPGTHGQENQRRQQGHQRRRPAIQEAQVAEQPVDEVKRQPDQDADENA